MRRAQVALVASAATAVALCVLPALAQETPGLRLRLQAYFAAKDDDARARALAALETAVVPTEPEKRAKLLRDGLGLAPKKPFARIDETLAGGGDTSEAFFVTPKSYDERKSYPAVLSLHGRHGTGHQGLQPFALPDEEWDEARKPLDEDMQKRGYKPGTYTIKRPEPKVPWEDGLVLAPTYMEKTADDVTLRHVEAACLAALERASRSYALDQDRVVLAGVSLGSAIAFQIAARHPDRFAAVFGVAGYAPGEPLENLRPLQVYIVHGDKDDDVPVAAGREMDARLKECGVTHVYREIAGMGHQWPERPEGAKARAWLKARVRTPWPREIHHRFERSDAPRRVFWVELPPGPEATVDAAVKENAVEVAATGGASLVLHLGEPLVDLDKEVVVAWSGKEAFRGKITRSWKELLGDLNATGFDLPRAAPARLEVKAP
jgi:predicted esterase